MRRYCHLYEDSAKTNRVIVFYILIICKIRGVAITGRSHSIAEHFYTIHVERLKLERVQVVMATKILVGHQAN